MKPRMEESCPFNEINLSNTKKTVDIVKNYYQSVYFWNIAYNQANLAAIQNQNRASETSLPPSLSPTLNNNRAGHLDDSLNQTQSELQGIILIIFDRKV
jgi:hypothetical protein